MSKIVIDPFWIRGAKIVVDKYAYQLASKSGGCDFKTLVEDLRAEGYVNIYRTKEYWNPDKPASFVHFASVIATRKMREHYNDYLQWRKNVKLESDLKSKSGVGTPNYIDTYYTADEDDSVLDKIERTETLERLITAIDDLNEPLGRIMTARFFENKTLEMVGKEMGVTRERVRQLSEVAFQKLRYSIGVEYDGNI